MTTAPTVIPAGPSSQPVSAPSDGPGPSMGNDLMAALSSLPKKGVSEPSQQEPKAPAQPQKQEPTKAKEAPKKTESSEKPTEKGTWDVDVESLEEPKIEEPPKAPEEPAPADLKPEAQTKWKELKSKATELDNIKPQYEALKKELETLKNSPSKPAPEIESELTELRQFKAAYDVENTPEFQEAVLKPYQTHMEKIAEVADFAKVPIENIQEALKERNTLARTRALRAVFDGAAEEVSSEEIGIVVRAADALHSDVFPKDKELRDKALEIQNSLKGKQEVLTAKQQEARETALKASSDELFNALSVKLKPLGIFDDANFTEKLKTVRPADIDKEPMKAISQAYAEALLPALMLERNKIAAELKQVKAALKARGAAGAGPSDSVRTEAQIQQQKDAEDGGSTLGSALENLLRRR